MTVTKHPPRFKTHLQHWKRQKNRERERCLDTIKTKKIARSGFNTNQQTVTTKKI